jgi:hypothetical protein
MAVDRKLDFCFGGFSAICVVTGLRAGVDTTVVVVDEGNVEADAWTTDQLFYLRRFKALRCDHRPH